MDVEQMILSAPEEIQEGVLVYIKQEDDGEADQHVDYESVEYLEDDVDYELIMEDTASSSQASTPEPRKRKWPKKMPPYLRNKTYKQYTTSELREAVERVLSEEMTCAEAARHYNIPKGTLLTKVNESTVQIKEDEGKSASTDKHIQLVEEVTQLMKYTNAIPFRTRANRYYCFFCSTSGPYFEDPDDLRSHTYSKHRQDRIHRIELFMKPQWSNEVIKLDVQKLYCTECVVPLPDWNNMFVHFAENHSIGFDEAYAKVIPYALASELACVLCNQSVHNYGQLDAHMNRHYSNHICHECGDTFLAANRLDKHLTVHKVGRYPCSMCDKVFTLDRYRAKHFALVHRQEKKIKCLHCKEKFVDMYQRHKHVTEAHPEKVRNMTCEVCGRVYTWKPYFLAHMRKRHKGEKTHKCQYCDKAFLMRYELRNHLVRHTGDKNYVCLCGDSFKRAHALRKHVEFAHNIQDILGDL